MEEKYKYFEVFELMQIFDIKIDADQKEILDGIAAISRLYEKREFGYELEICSMLNTMCTLLLRNLKERSSPHSQGRGGSNIAVQKILAYISRHYSERITLEQIAKELSVSQIAYETGFSSTSYFIGKFKAQLGVPPLQFRKNL